MLFRFHISVPDCLRCRGICPHDCGRYQDGSVTVDQAGAKVEALGTGHANKSVQRVQKAHCWVRENGADATLFLMHRGRNGGGFDMNVLLNSFLQFGVSDECTEASLREITENYVRLGLITNMSDIDEIMALAWTPVLD